MLNQVYTKSYQMSSSSQGYMENQNNIINNLDSSIGSSQRRGSNNHNIGGYNGKCKNNSNSHTIKLLTLLTLI